MNPVDEDMAAEIESNLSEIFDIILNSRLEAQTPLQIPSNLKPLFQPQNTQSSIFLEIFTNIEGCHPLLLEKWIISQYPPSGRNQEVLLSSHISDLPIARHNFQRPEVSISNISLKSWPKSLSQLEKFSFRQSFHSFGYLISLELPSERPFPDIMIQDLGSRPRLSSIELSDHLEIDLNSTPDDPIICLNQLTLNTQHPVPYTHFTTNTCTKEHDLIGFAPLSHTICSETASHLSHNSFSFSSSPFAEDPLTEDEVISVYKIKCDRLSAVSLFSSAQVLPLASLKSSLSRMKELLELL